MERSQSVGHANKPSTPSNVYILLGTARSRCQRGRQPDAFGWKVLRLSDPSFVRALQAENKALSIEVSRGSGCNTPTATPSINKQDSLPSTSWDTFSNTSEGQAENDVCVVADEISIQPQYIGEAACTTFVRRLQQHINGYPLPPSPSPSRYYKHPGLSVLSASDFRLPVRIEAQLLVRTVVRFIGPDYHLLPRKSLPEKMIATYQMPVYDDPIWICRLFVIFALGELYAHRAHSKKSRAVPGTIYFLKAMTILQEIHEEPSISYIETVLLIVSDVFERQCVSQWLIILWI